MKRTQDEIHEVFEKFNDDYLNEGDIKNKLSNRPDLCAFLILDKLFPSSCNNSIICSAEHDVIYLDISEEQAEELDDETIHDLVRCGVSHDGDGLYMYA